MKDHIDGYYVAAQIRLVRQLHKGAVLILEGDTDAKALGTFIDSDSCKIEIAFGKKNAVDALDLLEDEGFPGVVALVDADFDRISGKIYSLENLYLTDQHDLDLMIFSSSAFDRYIREHADVDKFKIEFRNDFVYARNRVVQASLPIAYCRLVSDLRNLRLRFKDLKHEKFVGIDDLLIDSEELIVQLFSSSSANCTTAQLESYVAIEVAKKHDHYQLANGHDVSAILGIALRKLLGNRRDIHTWSSEIEAGLRLSFDWKALIATDFYRSLNAWEMSNKPYRLFYQRP